MTLTILQARRRDWLRANMPRSGMNIEDLAAVTVLTPMQVRLLLKNGGASLTLERFKPITEALDVEPPAELMEGS